MSDSPNIDRHVAASARRGAPRPFDAELADFLEEVRQKALGPDEPRPADRLNAGRDVLNRLLIDMPSTATDRQALFSELGARLGRARHGIGPLADVFLAAEAWMVQRREALPGVLPSDHPSRIEILSVVTWQSSTNVYQVRIYRLLRDGDGKVCDLIVEQDWEEARAYLVEAFVNVYLQMIP
jgi:hypothetical protein